MDGRVTVTVPYTDFIFSIPFLIFSSKNILIFKSILSCDYFR
jgi:hypothetical protein